MLIVVRILLKILVVLLFNISDVFMLRSQKPVATEVWHEYCPRLGLALNDCNWCHCNPKLQFTCTARVCNEIDMFGHFKDTIQEIDVGMEGKGVWRTGESQCQAGVHYRKGELLCICSEDSKWPSLICRDVFQVLHSVESTKFEKPDNQECSPNKLYQIVCNTCYCPETGKINGSFCTQRNCSNDIVPQNKVGDVINNIETNELIAEIYAACERAKKYQLGCQTCVCLPNNRLLCDNCTSVNNFTVKLQVQDSSKNLCSNKIPGKRFKKDCNICYCDQKDVIYCTVYKCLPSVSNISLPKIEYESVAAPSDDYDCVPGTKYERECNTCHCFMLDGIKYFGCTVKKCDNCSKAALNDSTCSCVEGMRYEKNCLICQCLKVNYEKSEFCTLNDKCRDEVKDELEEKSGELRSLDSMHGYCEPLHLYEADCNKCRCLSDGKTISCTSKTCSQNNVNLKSMVVEFIPFIQKQNVCPKGHKYKVDCNLCHCMSNGNALCTTSVCKQKGLKELED